MTEIAVVGAGVAGLGVAYALGASDADTGSTSDAETGDAKGTDVSASVGVTVFETNSTAGGRAATRRRARCIYDVGANYVKGEDERVAELIRDELSAGLVEADGPVWTFDADGEISEGRDDDAEKWTYRDGLATLGDRLAEASGATVRTGTEVVGLARETDDFGEGDFGKGEWRLETESGEFAADAVVLTPPAPQTAELVAEADWDDPRRETLPDAIAEVPYRTILTVALHYDHRVETPYYALVNTDKDHELGWVAREECKPGHVPGGESLLVVQPSPTWSADHYDDGDDEIAVGAADRTAELLGDPDCYQFDWADVIRWRDALPDARADPDALADAADANLFFAGDWVAGEGRIHAALRSGLETGDRIREELS